MKHILIRMQTDTLAKQIEECYHNTHQIRSFASLKEYSLAGIAKIAVALLTFHWVSGLPGFIDRLIMQFSRS